MASSYQNNDNGEMSRLMVDNSMYGYHERGRNRLGLMLTLFSGFFALTASIFVWRVNAKKMYFRAVQSTRLASAARQSLNTRLHSQSKHMHPKCEATLMLARHCEKTGPTVRDADGNNHCSYIGQERAAHFATQFEPVGSPAQTARWPTPSQLFALTPVRREGDHWNFREWETVHPLSQQSGIDIDMVVDSASMADEYFDLLQAGSQCGKLTVVSWKHEMIPELAVLLGCGPDNGCPNTYDEHEFDMVWIIKYVFHPEAATDTDEDEMYQTNMTKESTNINDPNRRRRLSKSRERKGWNVYGTVGYQRFDSLQFSYQAGDYPEGGASRGGSWQEDGSL